MHRYSDPELQPKVWAEGETKKKVFKLPLKFSCTCIILFALIKNK